MPQQRETSVKVQGLLGEQGRRTRLGTDADNVRNGKEVLLLGVVARAVSDAEDSGNTYFKLR